ncbi:MAG: hypothetical protein HC818_05995 [Synechococcaceae cyanobacterium RM1_1_27]|nr:hypothetical protein [Synechococcaceae cyanobacterium RM1_1_27]
MGIAGWLGLLSVVNLLAILHHRYDYQQDLHQKQRRLESLRAYRHRQQDLLQHWDPSCQFFRDPSSALCCSTLRPVSLSKLPAAASTGYTWGS